MNPVVDRRCGQPLEQRCAETLAVKRIGDRKRHLGRRRRSRHAKVRSEGDDPNVAGEPAHCDQCQTLVRAHRSADESLDDRVGRLPGGMKPQSTRFGREFAEEVAHGIAISDRLGSHRRYRSVAKYDEPVVVLGWQPANRPHLRPRPR